MDLGDFEAEVRQADTPGGPKVAVELSTEYKGKRGFALKVGDSPDFWGRSRFCSKNRKASTEKGVRTLMGWEGSKVVCLGKRGVLGRLPLLR